MKNIKIKETYLLLLIVIGLVSLSIYSTYALFTASTSINDVVSFSTSLTTDSNILEYEMVTVSPGEKKIIELNITNSYGSTLYYGAWYEMIKPTSINSDIEIGLYTDKNSTPGSGTISNGTSISLLVGITNNSSSNVIVNVGTAGSLTSNLNLANTRSLLPSGWIDAILVTDEYLEAHKTTTTESVNLEYTTPKMTEVTLNPGTYKLEVWGAQGGYRSSATYGGKGGYSYGTLTLTDSVKTYVYVGGSGNTGGTAGGFNGGGKRGTYYGGGGASDIRLGTDSLYARVIVAGGGGSDGASSKTGMYGGGTQGGATTANYGTGGFAGTQTGVSSSSWQTTTQSTSTTTQAGAYAGFGFGGNGITRSSGYGGAGGGGWYGGSGSYPDTSGDDDRGGGGGSGYVYTSSTYSNYPSGCLLNSNYYLTDAATVAGNTSFTDFSGSTVTGHSGDGAVRISGTGEVTTYSIPRVVGLTDLTIGHGTTANLTNNVTIECETGQTGCSLVKTSITDTSTLEVGTYTIYYIVQGSTGNKYKYPRTLYVKDDFEIKNILVNNNTYQGIPTSGLYTMTSDCSNLSYDPLTKKVKVTDYTSNQSCNLNFTTSTNYPKLNTMKVGDYVAYVGNNGCNNGVSGTTGTGAAEAGNSCKGENANQSADTSGYTYGYCYDSDFRYYVYGWRIAYIENNKVYLISAGSPECRTRTSSTGNATQISDLNKAALDYCNSTYADGGTCSSSNTWAMGNTDFMKITNAISGTSSNLTSAYGSPYCYNTYSQQRCGYNNDLIDSGGYYWFAAYDTTSSTRGVSWYPVYRGVATDSVTYAYGFRPVITLSSNVYVTGGSGTMSDPYTIGI